MPLPATARLQAALSNVSTEDTNPQDEYGMPIMSR